METAEGPSCTDDLKFCHVRVVAAVFIGEATLVVSLHLLAHMYQSQVRCVHSHSTVGRTRVRLYQTTRRRYHLNISNTGVVIPYRSE